MQDANNVFLDAVNAMMSNASLSYDKTFPSVVYGHDADSGKYGIAYEGRIRYVYNALPCALSNGQLVWVKMPCGKLREMHICGLRNNKE